MTDKERDARLREAALERGFRLVKSRRRKPGGDFGRYGLADRETGAHCFGFGKRGLEATVDQVEAYLRRETAANWRASLAGAGAARKAGTAKSKRSARHKAPSPPPPPPPPPPAPKLRVRQADSVDAEAIAGLLSGEFAAGSEEISGRLDALIRDGEAPLVAKLGDEVVGVLAWHATPLLHRPAPVGRITFLEVDERHRRSGVGKALVEAAEKRLAKRGCRLVEVTSNVKLTQAHRFYRALGYERTSHRFAKPLKA